jgi:hypothetical protein
MNRHSILYIGLSYRPSSELFRNSTISAAGERSISPYLAGLDLLTRYLAADKVLFHRGYRASSSVADFARATDALVRAKRGK